jgi:hypothetical protein
MSTGSSSTFRRNLLLCWILSDANNSRDYAEVRALLFAVRLVYHTTLKMEVVYSSKTSVKNLK